VVHPPRRGASLSLGAGRSGRATDVVAFAGSGGVLLSFLVAGALDLEALEAGIESAKAGVTGTLGLFWQLIAVASFLVSLGLALSPFGRRRLGGADAPDMSYGRWLATILCTLLAGGGVFWSAAEPMYHFITPPPTYPDVEPLSAGAVGPALAQSFFHWGFLAWSVTGTLGAVVLMLGAERGQPIQPRSLLAPILPDGPATRWLGAAIDGASVLAAAAGTIGPIGFLGLQLAFAAEQTLGWRDGPMLQVAVVAALVVVATASAVSGVERGIQTISRINVLLTAVAALFLLVVGPTGFIVSSFGSGIALELRDLVHLSLYRGDPNWLSGWTVFYWGWFLGYGPIMSVFVARISRGRTVREVLLSISLVAPLLTAAWFALLGGTGLQRELATPGAISGPLGESGLGAALFAIIDTLPLTGPVTLLFVTLIFLFLVTSADSIAYGLSMVLSRTTHPPKLLRAFWSVLMGACASALLIMGGGAVDSLQAFIVIAAAPVSFVMATLPFVAPYVALRDG